MTKSAESRSQLAPEVILEAIPWQSLALISFYISEYRQFFWANDKDGDGLLSKTEFLAMLQNIGLSLNDRELEGLFQKTDKDGKFRKIR